MRTEAIVKTGICLNIYGLNIYCVYNYSDYCWVLDCYVTICMTYMCSTVIDRICGGEVFGGASDLNDVFTVFTFLLCGLWFLDLHLKYDSLVFCDP